MSWEVWTMKSKMSFFDLTLLKKNISRFAPAWGITMVMALLVFPVSALMDVNSDYGGERFLTNMAEMGPIIAFFSAIGFAALLFKYLHNPRSAYMIHAFPMTRTCLFLTNLVSGLLFFLIPVLLIFLANLGVFAVNGVFDCGSLHWTWLGKWILEYLFFYGLAVFCMFLSGSQFISGLSYAALNFIFLAIPVIFFQLVERYVNGFDISTPDWIMYLSPIVTMLREGEYATFALLAVYACVGVGLMGLGWWFYQQRHVERAGDAMVFPWAQHLFRLIFTFCFGLYFGLVFAAIHGISSYFLPFSIIGLFIGWFGSTMMLERTVKVFKLKKIWLGYGIFVAALLLTVAAMRFDILGFQRRVPETAEVKSVEITTNARFEWNLSTTIELTDPADIEVVRGFHARAAQNRQEADWRPFGGGFWDTYGHVQICYHLQNGGTLRREYRVELDETEKLAALYARPEVAAAWYAENLPEKYDDVVLECGTYYDTREFRCTDFGALREAILADAAAGRLPVINNLNYDQLIFAVESYNDNGMELTLVFRNRDEEHDMDVTRLQLSIPETATQTLAVFGISSLTELEDKKDITLTWDLSQFSDYQIRGNQVFRTCTLALENASATTQYGKISACFPDAVGTLVSEDRLPGLLVSEGEALVPMEYLEPSVLDLASGKSELHLVFVGTYTGGTQESPLLTPELYWTPLDSDEEIKIRIQ